ncbi:hypothetical protein JCM10512_4844 [Bacteroides reticulotermitis JCM 10512]|uniref:Uncharacterized protein n=1 Tax=Bacteroides reticulotermitis JCM 10512 TaxID=1445607 RepID=W4V0K3_9BACE|nr:hypothetical protein JCM10512_4844 [Bacteroides reticulotermitis JCM 10512]
MFWVFHEQAKAYNFALSKRLYINKTNYVEQISSNLFAWNSIHDVWLLIREEK